MGGYLHIRPTGPNLAPWQPAAMGGVVRDSAAPQDPPIPAAMPDRAPRAIRAAIAAFALVVPPPPDQAAASPPPAPACMPARAQGPARSTGQNYAITQGPQHTGPTPHRPEMPSRAPGRQRAAPDAYRGLISPTPPEDAGFVGSRGGPRTPNRYRFRRLPEPAPYTLIVSPPPDSGAAVQDPARPVMPASAPAPRRAPPTAYAALRSATPPDAGVVPAPPPIQPSMPDRAPGRPRAAYVAYSVALDTPGDAGIVVTFPATIDTFTGVSNTSLTAHTPDAGGSWTQHPSYSSDQANITSAGRARAGSGSDTSCLLYWSGIPPTADYSVSADVTRQTGTGSGAICGRLDVASETYYFARVNGLLVTLDLGKRVGGSETILGTYTFSGGTYPLGTSHNVTLSMNGATITAWLDGSLVLSANDSSISAAGKVGIALASENIAVPDAKQVQLDNLAWSTALSPPDPLVVPAVALPQRARPRAANAAYWVEPGTPPDQGLQPVVAPEMPDSAPRQRRASWLAYQLIVQPVQDVAAAPAPPILPEMPDSARRAARQAYWIAPGTPLDAGTAGFPPSAPDVARGQRRASDAAYRLVVPAPADAGTRPIPASMPGRAPGPLPRPGRIIPPTRGPNDFVTTPIFASDLGTGRDLGIQALGVLVTNFTVLDSGHAIEATGTAAGIFGGDLGQSSSTASASASVFASDKGSGLNATDETTTGTTTPWVYELAVGSDSAWVSAAAFASELGAGLEAGAVLQLTPVFASDLGTAREAAAVVAAIFAGDKGTGREGGFSGLNVFVSDTGTSKEMARGAPRTIQYHVYANAGDGGPVGYTTPIATTAGLSYATGGLPNTGLWRFGVRAFETATGKEERNLDYAEVSIDASWEDITAMPAAPSNLRLIALPSGNLRVIWGYANVIRDHTPDGFRVYRGTGGVVDYDTPIAVVPFAGLSTYHADATGLTNGVAYVFGVRAYNATAEEANVVTVSGTSDASPPDAVDGLTATGTVDS